MMSFVPLILYTLFGFKSIYTKLLTRKRQNFLDKPNGEMYNKLYKLYFWEEYHMSDKMPKGKFISTVKVGEKGQIVIPKPARDMFSIKPGDTVLLLADEDRGIAIVSNDVYMDFAEAIFAAQERKDDEK